MKALPGKIRPSTDVGLTLVELLVVLSILAVLSTVALRSVVGTFEENNYDANISQMDQIELAILGGDDSAGFVRDIGRLPEAIGDAEYDPDTRTGNLLTQLGELWSQGTFPQYAVNQGNGLDSEIRLGTGWRGPYLNLGINRTDLTDGFANPFVYYQADGTLADDTDPIAIIQSFGANGGDQFGTTGDIEIFPDVSDSSYDEDVETVFAADAAAVTANLSDTVQNRWQTQMDSIQVEREDGSEFEIADGQYLVIRAYGPNDGILQTIYQSVVDLDDLDDIAGSGNGDGSVTSADSPSTTTGEWVFSPPGFQFTGPTLANGLKVFRAYQIDNATAAPGMQDELIGDGSLPEPTLTVEWKSPPTFFVVGSPDVPPTLRLYEEP